MAENFVARASTTIDAPPARIWEALVNPDKIRSYMFGTNVESDWREGSSIKWKGEWEGKSYEDKGEILTFRPERRLQYTHFSPMTGKPDVAENYHTVTIDLVPEGGRTNVTLSQDKNATEEERQHSEKNWSMMLDGLKKLVEG